MTFLTFFNGEEHNHWRGSHIGYRGSSSSFAVNLTLHKSGCTNGAEVQRGSGNVYADLKNTCLATSGTTTPEEKKWAMSIVSGAAGGIIGYLIRK